MAGLLAALAYGMVMQLVMSPAMVKEQTAMTSGETRSMEEVGPLVDEGRKPLILMVARMVGAERTRLPYAPGFDNRAGILTRWEADRILLQP
jgi:hypothetical protein